jgi:hypothetical protein
VATVLQRIDDSGSEAQIAHDLGQEDAVPIFECGGESGVVGGILSIF